MRLTCMGCGAHGSYELFTNDGEARATFAAAQRLPAGLGGPMLDYLTLFRPAQRLLSWKRAKKLLEELVPMLESGTVTRNGRKVPCEPQAWRKAIEQMLEQRERLSLPLKSHGYLLEVVLGSLPKLAAEAETAAEAGKRDASNQRRAALSQAHAELSSEIAARVRLKLPPMTSDEQRAFMDERAPPE